MRLTLAVLLCIVGGCNAINALDATPDAGQPPQPQPLECRSKEVITALNANPGMIGLAKAAAESKDDDATMPALDAIKAKYGAGAVCIAKFAAMQEPDPRAYSKLEIWLDRPENRALVVPVTPNFTAPAPVDAGPPPADAGSK